MTDEKWELAKTIMNEYFSALRGSWGDIDGRSEKYAWEGARALIDSGIATLADLRREFELCPYGRGHWTEYCRDFCVDLDNPKN